MIKEAWKEEVQYIPDTPLRIVVDDQISLTAGNCRHTGMRRLKWTMS